jgi:hypothetical protein
MNNINRILIFILLLTLLYALYKYQQHIMLGSNKDKSLQKKKIKRLKTRPLIKYEDVNNKDTISLDNISQISIGSIDDTNAEVYKPDSVIGGSVDSGNISFLDTKSNDSRDSKDSSFFFQK